MPSAYNVAPRARALSHDFTMATHSEHAHYITKWRIRHTQLSMHRTHPLLCNYYQDNAKLACHCAMRYKMEWIYTQTKMRGGGSLELTQETRKKD